MGYTSGAAMDERGLRDVERWRDKIEVRLDNRQVFFLFFGSALVACLLFILGVIVGKRLESRGRAVAPEVEDQLALLDRIAAVPRAAQSANGAANQGGLTAKAEIAAPRRTEAKSEAKPEAKPIESKAAEKPVEPAKLVAKTDKPAPVEAAKAPDAAKHSEGRPLAKVESKPDMASPTKPGEGKAPAAGKTVAAAPPAAPVPMVAAGATDAAKGKVRFTLQLSSFQDRAEAEAFAKKFGVEKTYLVASDIPGKGTWYRVRVGEFASAKEAIAGKLAFEKKYNVIAYVAQK